MDLSKLNLQPGADSGATMVVRHPVTDEELIDDQGRKTTITLVGTESRRFKNRVDFHLRSREKSRKKGMSLSQSERESADILAHATLAWENISWEGQPLPFSVENATMVYEKLGWLRQQVDEFVAESANFFKSPSSN